MSLRLVPKLSVESSLAQDEISLKRLRDAVLGKDPILPRGRAMDLLQSSGFSHRHRDFERVLQDQHQPVEARCLAAAHLGKVATPAAVKILLQHCYPGNQSVLASVLSALGRIGDEPALQAVIKAQEHAQGLAAANAAFAATLIAHRLGIAGNTGAPLESVAPLAPDHPCARPFRVTRPDPADAARCLWSLGSHPFGIELAEHSMCQARCGKNTWMVALNRDFSDAAALDALTARKAILGVVALRGPDAVSYSVTYLMLTSPGTPRQQIDILLYRPNGTLTLRGTAQVSGQAAAFSLLALPNPGAVAANIAGTFENGQLKITTSLATPYVQVAKREPIRQTL